MQAWHDFIQQLTIKPLQANNSLCVADDLGLLYVGGDDASDFLQNQLSNDITLLDEQSVQLSSFSNAKGRMHAVLRIIKIEGGYLLLLPRSILADIQQLLQKYILMSRVVMADITDSFARFSFTTDNTELTESAIYPAEVNHLYQSDSLICLRVPAANDNSRFLLLTNQSDEAIELFSALQQALVINGYSSWRLQEILAGIPTLYAATEGAFVLQMCNLQLLDGVNFKKGCYPGQEVVARMHYLGKLKRRMYLAQLNSSECPAAGDELKSRSSQKSDGSGKVVDAVQLSANQCYLLFSAQIDKVEAGELVLEKQPQSSLKLIDLPYPFTE